MRTDYVDLEKKPKLRTIVKSILKGTAVYTLVFLACILLLILGTSDLIWAQY